jgi:hypothetical protein
VSWWRRPRLGVTPRVAAHTLVGVGNCSCKAETCRERRRLLGGDPSSRELVEDTSNLTGTGRLANEGLDRGTQSSSS